MSLGFAMSLGFRNDPEKSRNVSEKVTDTDVL
jgi:hypothetical protein